MAISVTKHAMAAIEVAPGLLSAFCHIICVTSLNNIF